ncbi:hypothetical protein [Pseudogemmobacter sonorensis]|uniref:hypothetical protein n=1 Tax=Pseudogemmobacter sonorensis TaxID=2989681 RepID=UPI0036B09210
MADRTTAPKGDLIEAAAKLIYERGMLFMRTGKPAWVERGNSIAQTEARRLAREILEMTTPSQGETPAAAEPVAGWPERIWADQDNLTWVEADPNEVMRGDEVCYIRADLAHPSGAESLWAEVNRLTAEVEVAWKGERDQWLHDYDAMTKKRDAALARVAELEASLGAERDSADEKGE